VEARSLNALVEAVLRRAWRRDSRWHGEIHWRCVTATGLELAAADERVDRSFVFCFGLLHDTRRENEAVDPGHGPRAAASAEILRREGALILDDPAFADLTEALRRHSDGLVSADPTIGTCWDADRLHLPRVSIVLDPALLSTAAAREPRRLSEADALRQDGPPEWEALVELVSAPTA
jgi:uncharacterized protein